VGFCGVEIIRRILGLAHVAELEEITDDAARAPCETRALFFAREILVNRQRFVSVKDLLACFA
jgi:5-methylthioribose kinase